MDLFFYGTLMHPKILQRVILSDVSELTIRPATLLSYSRHRVTGVDYPAVVPDDSQSVKGTLVKGLSPWAVKRLDVFEGDEYSRKSVKVMVEGQDLPVEARTYVWSDNPSRLDKAEWDFNDFVQEKLGRWVDREDEYTMLEDVDTTGGRNLDTFWERNVIAERTIIHKNE